MTLQGVQYTGENNPAIVSQSFMGKLNFLIYYDLTLCNNLHSGKSIINLEFAIHSERL